MHGDRGSVTLEKYSLVLKTQDICHTGWTARSRSRQHSRSFRIPVTMGITPKWDLIRFWPTVLGDGDGGGWSIRGACAFIKARFFTILYKTRHSQRVLLRRQSLSTGEMTSSGHICIYRINPNCPWGDGSIVHRPVQSERHAFPVYGRGG